MPAAPPTFTSQTELLSFLVEVGDVLSTRAVDLDALVETLSEFVRQVVDYEIFVVLLHQEGQRVLKIRHAVGLPEEMPEEMVQKVAVPLGRGITGSAAQEGRTIVVNDVSKDARYINLLDSVRSEMAVPLIARGKTVGVLDLQSTRPAAFTDYERQMLELIASRVSSAVDNARLLARTGRQNAALKTLLELSQEFSTILNLDELMEEVARVTRRLIDYDAYSIFLLEPGRKKLRHYASFRYDQRTSLDSVPIDKGIVGAAARTRKPVLVSNTVTDAVYTATLEGVKSEVAVPLILRDRVIGVLALESDRANFFTEDHADTLATLASQLAAAIENARLYEETARDREQLKNDLIAARRIQRDLLLPDCPEFAGVEIAAYNEPMQAVSGDFYDFYVHGGSRLGILLGDVSGKGAGAALYGALVSGLLRSLVRLKQSPAELLADVNQVLHEHRDPASTFAAVAYAQWDPADRSLLIANSGLPFPLIRRKGRVTAARVAGVPLGMLPEGDYEEAKLELQPGDFLVIASDGVLESENPAGEEYGERRLASLLEMNQDSSPQDLLQAISDDLQRHTRGAPPKDDQTLLAMKITA